MGENTEINKQSHVQFWFNRKNMELSCLLTCTAKIPKIMGVANKKPFCNATPLYAFYAAVLCVDADFLDITYAFVCSCLEYFEIAFTLPKSLYACIL